MVGESRQRRVRPSSRHSGTDVRKKLAADQPNNFGTVVRALWPDKPALNLSQRAGCTERAAQFYITGDREPSYEALMVVLDEMRPRKRA